MTTPGYANQNSSIPDSQNHRPPTKVGGRIYGLQTAVVTAEEHSDGTRPEINADKTGSVRVRFPWDQRTDTNDGTPSSGWIRVSQYWAGAGYGALYTPRVGHEVLVAFLDGNPARPVIVGRVYNSKNRPPYDPSGEDKTKSTIKSDSSADKDPEGDSEAHTRGFNEIRLEDRAKQEEIYVHAQRNLIEQVNAFHGTYVGGDQENHVHVDQDNHVEGSRTHTVDGEESVTVGGNRSTRFLQSEGHYVELERDTLIGINDQRWVMASDNVSVAVDRYVIVGSYQEEQASKHAFITKTDFSIRSKTLHSTQTDSFTVNSDTLDSHQRTSFDVKAGSASLHMSSGVVFISNGAGASIMLCGGVVMITGGCAVSTSSGGPTTVVSGGPMLLASGGEMNGVAPKIDLNG